MHGNRVQQPRERQKRDDEGWGERGRESGNMVLTDTSKLMTWFSGNDDDGRIVWTRGPFRGALIEVGVG